MLPLILASWGDGGTAKFDTATNTAHVFTIVAFMLVRALLYRDTEEPHSSFLRTVHFVTHLSSSLHYGYRTVYGRVQIAAAMT